MFKSFIEVRKIFLDFFKSKNHVILKGSSLVSNNDDSLLFTNAGMNQFKNIFLGIENIKYKNIATTQYCLRVGGKHNDLNNIGYTTRHNTFFEMMGNFSFNSYFKEIAIIYAWELLTSKDWYFISKDNLFVTVHKNDKETYNIWLNIIGLSKNNIFILGNDNIDIDLNSSNFWRMSEFGPCGYSTEIFFTNNLSSIKLNSNLEIDCNNCLEIWNLVFVEFNLESNYKITNLSYKSVDTGIGLERISSILQNTFCNFEIDIFRDIKNIISKFINIEINNLNKYIFNIISDHIRSIVFILLEDILPSNEFRGYILRKIIRRTIWHIRLLKINNCILYKLFDNLYSIFNKNYIIDKKKFFNIKNIVYDEEKKFLSNLDFGIKILNSFISKLDKYKNILESKKIFLLYDTYGLPIDLIVDICKFNGVNINLKKFNILLNIQRNKSKKNSFLVTNKIMLQNKTKFLGFKKTECISKILYILEDNLYINKIDTNNKKKISIILNKTILYPQSGGQKGDKGLILKSDIKSKFVIQKTKLLGNIIIHIGYIDYGLLSVGDIVKVNYNIDYRHKISCNHSSTHLLKYILGKVLKIKVIQKGSKIKSNIFSFDFFYNKNLNKRNIFKINKLMNLNIWNSISVNIIYVQDNNKKINFFSKKNFFRVVSIGNISTEYCCGTHIINTKEIGLFILINNYSISSGIKRIECMTYLNALKYINKQLFFIQDISNYLSVSNNLVLNRIKNIFKKNKKKQNEFKEIKLCYVNDILKSLNIKINNIICLNKINFIVKKIKYFHFLENKNLLFLVLNKIKFKFKLNIILFVMFLNNFKINYVFCIDKYILNKINFFSFDKDFFLFYDKKKSILENKLFSIYFLVKNNIKCIYLYNIDNLISFIKKKIINFKGYK